MVKKFTTKTNRLTGVREIPGPRDWRPIHAASKRSSGGMPWTSCSLARVKAA